MRRRFILVIPLLLVTVLKLVAMPARDASKVVRVSVDGIVHPITAEIIGDAIQQAEQQQASLILILLNTPGGLLEATRECIARIIASRVPVATYVEPSGGRAASAGFFLLEAGDVAAMAPGTNTGAASPVLIGQTMDPVMRSKAENDAAALLRGLVSHRKRNSEAAEKTVREAKAFTDSEALSNRLIDMVAENETQLLTNLNRREVVRFNGTTQVLALANATVVDVDLTARERLIGLIADPNVGFVLVILGILGIYVEFTSPGMVLPGIAGALLLLLGLMSLAVLPINWAGVALIILALALFLLELKLTAHGTLGVGGTIAMLLGAVILINGPPAVRIRWTTAAAMVLPFALIMMFLISLVVKARRSQVLTGSKALMNEIGIARTALTPRGEVFVRGEYWQAVASSEVNAGESVRVTGVDGLLLHVQRVA